jgi:iron(III) transport system permease protein
MRDIKKYSDADDNRSQYNFGVNQPIASTTVAPSIGATAAAPVAPAQEIAWLQVGLFLVGALLVLPLLALAMAGLSALGSGTLAHLFRTVLAETVWTSALLAGGTLAGTLVVGVACAWCVERYEFTGRAVWAWLLVLPLAMPTYVVAYAYTDLLQFSGPVQRALRESFGFAGRLPEVRSLPGAIVLFSFVLYPYVYVMARTAFAEISASAVESARLLGQTQWQTFQRTVLPMAWPSVAAGALLVLMETLADVGATHYFGLLTFSAGIYKTWIALGDKSAAVLLAVVLLLVVALIFWVERRVRGRAQRASTRGQRPWAREALSRRAALRVSVLLSVPLLVGFVIPVTALLWLLAREPEWVVNLQRFWRWTINTFTAGILGATLTVGLALAFVYALRFSAGLVGTAQRGMATVLQFGYAVPGAVIALAILWPVAAADRWVTGALGLPATLLTGSLTVLILAYMLRFFAVAFGGLQAGMERVTPHLDDAARTLGASKTQVFWRVHWPLLSRSLLAAWLLVMIDVMKELPATLMLRPFNFDTLAVIAQQLAQDERLAEAALPSLAIVVVGIIPVLLMSRLAQR